MRLSARLAIFTLVTTTAVAQTSPVWARHGTGPWTTHPPTKNDFKALASRMRDAKSGMKTIPAKPAQPNPTATPSSLTAPRTTVAPNLAPPKSVAPKKSWFSFRK
jgi:hypothetical protein